MFQGNYDLPGFLSRCLFISNALRADAGAPLNGRYHSYCRGSSRTALVLGKRKKSDNLWWQCRDCVDQRVRASTSLYHTAPARTADVEEILYASVYQKLEALAPIQTVYVRDQRKYNGGTPKLTTHPNTRSPLIGL